jgi:hypothetical protein
MTKGEYRMWSKFNHISNDKVGKIRRQAADLIDLIDDIATPDNGLSELDREIIRLKQLAMDAAEEAAMWAVKAATKGPME